MPATVTNTPPTPEQIETARALPVPTFDRDGITIYCGDSRDVLRGLPDASVNCCVTSPPYFGLRDYGMDGQIGLEPTPAEYVAEMVKVFREVRRVLRDDGTLWLNIGDSYNNAGSSRNGEGLDGNRRGGATGADGECGYKKRDNRRAWRDIGIKHKDLIGIPWALAFALRADGWYLRSDIIWAKPNPMPESVTDRPTKAHEYIFLLSKNERYFYDADAIRDPHGSAWIGRASVIDLKANSDRNDGGAPPTTGNEAGRNKRSVWTVNPQPFPEAHFATFPPKLIEPCILAGCPIGGLVLDPFCGAGTTPLVCMHQHVRCIGIELNPEYCGIIADRLHQPVLPFGLDGAA